MCCISVGVSVCHCGSARETSSCLCGGVITTRQQRVNKDRVCAFVFHANEAADAQTNRGASLSQLTSSLRSPSLLLLPPLLLFYSLKVQLRQEETPSYQKGNVCRMGITYMKYSFLGLVVGNETGSNTLYR